MSADVVSAKRGPTYARVAIKFMPQTDAERQLMAVAEAASKTQPAVIQKDDRGLQMVVFHLIMPGTSRGG